MSEFKKQKKNKGLRYEKKKKEEKIWILWATLVSGSWSD